MRKLLKEKLTESAKSILPVAFLILIIGILTNTLTIFDIGNFIFSLFFLIVGLTLFTTGADISIMTIGERIGTYLTKSKKITKILFYTFIIGVFMTIAEPDLAVLAKQVTSIPPSLLMAAVGLGAGLFLLIAAIRMIFQVKMPYLLTISYMLVFLIAFFVPDTFLPLAFDSGGVTTGSMSVPFILALGIGIASIRSDNRAKDDTFGLIGICSIGPVLAILILGLLYQTNQTSYAPYVITSTTSFMDILKNYILSIPGYMKEIAIVLLPILSLFLLLKKKLFKKREKRVLNRVYKGLVYTYIGLVLFLTGVSVGFMPIGYSLGKDLVQSGFTFLLIPIGMLIGYLVVTLEPAVQVLNEQVEAITQGNINKKAMNKALSIGVSLSVGISLLRVLTGISIWYFLIPSYILAVFLSYVVPPIFTAIAFDSGGIASGTMTASFLLPFAVGACEMLGGNVLTDAFGLVAIASTFPLITVQFIGLIYKLKTKDMKIKDIKYNEEIINFE